MAKSRKYQDFLIEQLKDDDEAVAYLSTVLKESLNGDEESHRLLQVAIRNVAEAHGWVVKVEC